MVFTRIKLISRQLLRISVSSVIVLSLIRSVNRQAMSFEEQKEHYLTMPLEEKRKQYRCGDNYKTLADAMNWTQYAKYYNITNKSSSDFEVNPELNDKIHIFTGDITALEVDSIVNAANEELRAGGGVCGAIFSAAGIDLLEAECETLDGCPTGMSKITGGYKLPAKYIIHTVGPVGERRQLLEGCYTTALELLAENKLKSIAFPCISTGIYGYPNEKAAEVALKTVRTWLDNSPYAKETEAIVFCLFLPIDIKIYKKLLPIYFPLQHIQSSDSEKN